ncbi:MAG: hypothetical protein HY695_33575 [Deltaproteobacteria bacterium]|nr:hypothetical protein [Deltaproteobacteria bacterium]
MARLVYSLQNVAIHEARRQLEAKGVLDPWAGLDQIRDMAAQINGGIRSISKLSLEQRRILIERLIQKGAQVRNPHIYESDLKAEREASGLKGPRKVLLFSRVNEEQLRLVDALAARISWPKPDSYERFVQKLFGAPRPRNDREVTRLATILRSMIERQEKKAERAG